MEKKREKIIIYRNFCKLEKHWHFWQRLFYGFPLPDLSGSVWQERLADSRQYLDSRDRLAATHKSPDITVISTYVVKHKRLLNIRAVSRHVQTLLHHQTCPAPPEKNTCCTCPIVGWWVYYNHKERRC
jgi:hypothetical protein